MVDRTSLASMKAEAYVINVARGPVVHTEDLLTAIRDGRLAGAGLDVHGPEPLPTDHELRRFPNVLLSPHNAGRTFESQAEALGRMRENVRLVLSGGPTHRPGGAVAAIQQASNALHRVRQHRVVARGEDQFDHPLRPDQLMCRAIRLVRDTAALAKVVHQCDERRVSRPEAFTIALKRFDRVKADTGRPRRLEGVTSR